MAPVALGTTGRKEGPESPPRGSSRFRVAIWKSWDQTGRPKSESFRGLPVLSVTRVGWHLRGMPGRHRAWRERLEHSHEACRPDPPVCPKKPEICITCEITHLIQQPQIRFLGNMVGTQKRIHR